MSETMLGVFAFVVLMVGAFAASRVLARFTAARFSRAMSPLVPVIEGAFSTDSLSNGYLEGSYRGREVQATATPGVAPSSASGTGSVDKSDRYNAFEVALLGVPGDRDWAIQFGSHTIGQIFSRSESWRFIGDDDLKEQLRSTPLVAELEASAGAGVRGFPTLRYNARAKTLTHRDSVFPGIAPPPDHFRKQLDLVLRLGEIVRQMNPGAAAPAQ